MPPTNKCSNKNHVISINNIFKRVRSCLAYSDPWCYFENMQYITFKQKPLRPKIVLKEFIAFELCAFTVCQRNSIHQG